MCISFQIIIATLSFLGMYFCLKTLASLIFTSNQIAATVIIDKREEIKNLDLLLSEASSALYAVRRQRLAVIIPKDIWNSCDLNEKIIAEKRIKSFGSEFYVI